MVIPKGHDGFVWFPYSLKKLNHSESQAGCTEYQGSVNEDVQRGRVRNKTEGRIAGEGEKKILY